MINLSIDPPHPRNSKVRNETESIGELIAENIFDQDIPENDDTDPEKYAKGLDLFLPSVGTVLHYTGIPAIEHFSYCVDQLASGNPCLFSPPPDLV